MPRYVMKQKLFFCMGDDFTIYDDAGKKCFYVDGKVLKLRQTLGFEDMEGNELARIQKKILSIGPTYELYRGGKLYATVKKSLFTLFRCKFSIDVPGPEDIEAKGSFLEHDYKFKRVTDGKTVAKVSKKWISITDSYGVDIADEQDDVLILAATAIIDMCCHDEKTKPD
jgi:uncharacterized protein YxjI